MTRKKQYIGVVRHSPGADFVIEFPDFMGCISSCKSLEECRGKAEAKLQQMALAMAEDRKHLPKPTPMKKIMEDPYYADTFIFWSELDV